MQTPGRGGDVVDPNDVLNQGEPFDPHPMMAAARRATPVLRLGPDQLAQFPGAKEFDLASQLGDGGSVWVCFRRDEVVQVLRDTASFCSKNLAAFGGTRSDPARPSLPTTDGAEHTRLRRLVGHAFSPSAIRRWRESFIEPLAYRLIDAFASSGRAELNEQFAMELPVQVISRMLGLPARDHDRFRAWTFDFILAGVDPKRAAAARRGLARYVASVITNARRSPGDDLLSELASADAEGDRLTDDEIIGAIPQIVVAGNETTFRAIGTTMYALLTHREELERVLSNPELVPKAVQEALRWEPPLPFDARTAIRPTTLAGQEIRPGDLVVVSIVSANRDEAHYDEPNRFRVDRSNSSSHLAFATGPHLCLGAHLAEIEIQISVAALLDRLPNIRLDESFAPVPAMRGTTVRGPSRVPVLFDPPKAG